MEFKFNDAKSARPGHLERCLCYDKFLKGYRCYVYDDISKYWCTQATTEHDPDGENHIVDYADFQVTEWASLSNVNKPSLPSDLDEAANKYANKYDDINSNAKAYVAFKAGAEWMAGQGITFEGKASRRYENDLAGFVSWILFDQQKAANLLVNQGEEADVIINIRKK